MEEFVIYGYRFRKQRRDLNFTPPIRVGRGFSFNYSNDDDDDDKTNQNLI